MATTIKSGTYGDAVLTAKWTPGKYSVVFAEDNENNTSYETYLRGELLTYSERTLALYGQFIVKLAGNRQNLACMIMENTARAYGYDGLDDMEAKI